MCHDVMLKLLTRSIGKILLVRAVAQPSSGIRYCQIDHGDDDHNDDHNDVHDNDADVADGDDDDGQVHRLLSSSEIRYCPDI